MHMQMKLAGYATVLTLGLASANAAVIDVASLNTDDPIDPVNDTGYRTVSVEATGSTALADLEAVDGLGGLQSFAGAEGGTNIYDIQTAEYPDLRVSFSGGVLGSAGNEITNLAFATSGSSSIRMAPSSGGGPAVAEFDLGAYDAEGAVFDGAVRAAAAFGFTIAAPAATINEATSYTAAFYDADDNLLSTQTYAPAADNTTESVIYFGYHSPGAPIGRVVFTVDWTGDGPIGIDDIAFTPIPEPGSLGLLGLGAAVIASRRRPTN